MFPVKESVKSGETQKLKIRRDNSHEDGVIILALHLTSTDTARVVGITEGLTAGGDLEKGWFLMIINMLRCLRRVNLLKSFQRRNVLFHLREYFFPAGTNERTIKFLHFLTNLLKMRMETRMQRK